MHVCMCTACERREGGRERMVTLIKAGAKGVTFENMESLMSTNTHTTVTWTKNQLWLFGLIMMNDEDLMMMMMMCVCVLWKGSPIILIESTELNYLIAFFFLWVFSHHWKHNQSYKPQPTPTHTHTHTHTHNIPRTYTDGHTTHNTTHSPQKTKWSSVL